MSFSRVISALAAAALVPAVATAQTYDPDTAPPPPPAPANQPVVVVNPPAATPPPVVEAPPPAMAYVPESDVEYDSINAPVFTTGALVFGVTYGASVITAASSDHPGADRLYVPVVGPWLALSDWGDCPIALARCDSTTTDKVLLVADGVFQAASLITMVDGLLDPGYHHARLVRTAQHVAPTGNGFAVIGAF